MMFKRPRFRRRRKRSLFRKHALPERLESRNLLAVDAVMQLGPITVSGNTASAEVGVQFEATAGEMLAYFSVDLEPSSANLIAAGPDFSAFTFTPTTPLLDGWTQIGFLNDPGFESSVEFDDSLTSALAADSYTLGTISVDLAAVGVTISDAFTISIEGADTAIGVVEPGQGFRFEQVRFEPGSRERMPVTISGGDTTNEGDTYTLTIDSQITTDVDYIIDWGDGQQDTISNADLPANGEVTHIFADGNQSHTIEVDLENGGRSTIGQIDVTVNNVAPTASLTGEATVEEGALYILSLGAITDPGDDTVSQYVIDWGDGQVDTIDAQDLPSNREVSHRYADGDSAYNISATLTDEDGTHSFANAIAVGVSNVSPTFALAGTANVNEGATFILTLGDVIDPGDDSVTEYTINWGDGQQETISSNDLPANREVRHVFADGETAPTILVTLVDEDGRHENAGSLAIAVNNVPPTLTLLGADSVEEGSPYTLTLGSISDPGTDTVVEYVIDWGDGQQDSIASGALPVSREVSHTYEDGAAAATISVTLVDEDGSHPAAGTLALAVTNVSPTVPLSGSPDVDEGSVYTLSVGQVVDAGDDTVTTYNIDWGDGQQESIAAVDLPANGQVPHTFADGSTSATIQVELVDEDGSHPAAGTLSLAINNVSPTVTVEGNPTGNIGEAYEIRIGDISDPGDDTVSQFIIDWGDGQVDTIQTADLPADGRVAHTYTQGGTTATISVSVVDEDGRHDAAGMFDVFVNDAPPEIQLAGESSVAEGSTYRLTFGEITGPRRGQVTEISIDWRDGTQQTLSIADIPTDRTLDHIYLDGPAKLDILVQLLNASGDTLTTASQPLEVLSVAPEITDFGNSASVPGETLPRETVTVRTAFEDPGILDTHTAVVDWGDGSTPTASNVSSSNGRGEVRATHQYATGGIYTVTVEITDSDGATVTNRTTSFITGIREANGFLQIVGSDQNDIVTFESKGADQVFVDMTVPPLGNFRRSFQLADVPNVELFVGAGNDRVMVSDRLNFETYLDGGPGNDHLQGGDGFNTILGGPGDDRLLGGETRDVLVGGQGANRLFGYGGQDLLLGANTEDITRDNMTPILIWQSGDSLDDREAAIRSSLDVRADQATDTIFGGTGDDLYLVSDADLIQEGQTQSLISLAQAKASEWAEPTGGSADVYAVRFDRAVSVANGEGPAPREGEAEAELSYSSLDINRDGHVSPLDVVSIINELNRNGVQQLDSNSRFDANGNGWIAPDDVLLIINRINSGLISAEGEAAPAMISDEPQRGTSGDPARQITPPADGFDAAPPWVSQEERIELADRVLASCSAELTCLLPSELENGLDNG